MKASIVMATTASLKISQTLMGNLWELATNQSDFDW